MKRGLRVGLVGCAIVSSSACIPDVNPTELPGSGGSAATSSRATTTGTRAGSGGTNPSTVTVSATTGALSTGGGSANGGASSTGIGSSTANTGGAGGAGGSSSTGTGCHDSDHDGVTDCAGDCDDNDPDVFPGHLEICGDGKDNDCKNGIDDGCMGLGTFVSNGGSDANPGTQAMPLATINHGIATAVKIGGGRSVYVSAGHYPEDVNLVEGVSLYGGYAPSTWVRDVANNDTAILTQSATGVVAGNSITRATVIDGFRVQGSGAAATNMRAIAMTLQGGTPTVTNNIINGPSAPAGIRSIALSIQAPSNDAKGALVSGNKINGATTMDASWGVAFETLTFPAPAPGAAGELRGNVIVGGSGTSSRGIYAIANADGVVVADNDISGGSSAADSFAVNALGGPGAGKIILDGNRINVPSSTGAGCSAMSTGPGQGWCGGVRLAGAIATLTNNVIFGNASPSSAGVWMTNFEGGALGTVILNGNYVDGGGVISSGSGTRSAAIVLTLTAGVSGTVGRIRNDILAGGVGSQRYGVYEDSVLGKTCKPEVLTYSDFFFAPQGVAPTLYRTFDGTNGGSVNTISALNATSGFGNDLAADPLVDATFHLKQGSPCIDAGTATEAPALDFDGEMRPKGAAVDIGPDEK